ncbi:hypothetical protein EYF80_057926 [Liparis tanakae]|uniref:PAR14-like first RRM domain-containing protein n=1 Tax=Liparis tanakae TaxID=230148 RepID=A0A4Z2ESZ9_9TELE|nr:hypothetical protein EYF80_057926 [Liparis tanakae]
MGDIYQHPVFFEYGGPLGKEQAERIETYFRVKQKSGGGDCGALERVIDRTHRVLFKYQEDQQAVLQRSEHVVDGLVFSVRGSPEPLTSPRDQSCAAAPLQVGSPLSWGRCARTYETRATSASALTSLVLFPLQTTSHDLTGYIVVVVCTTVPLIYYIVVVLCTPVPLIGYIVLCTSVILRGKYWTFYFSVSEVNIQRRTRNLHKHLSAFDCDYFTFFCLLLA